MSDISSNEVVGGNRLVAVLILEPLLDVADVAINKTNVSQGLYVGRIGLLQSYSKVDGV